MQLDEIDQKQLKHLRNKFLGLSKKRFERMESNLSPVQADYLKLLPLLFHVNHPMLPGYVDKFTPCGIPNYSPSRSDKQIVKTVSQSFEYKPRAHLSYRLAALFLMGSMGTLGQSNSSDIDLWICLAEPLEQKLLSKLENKASRIKNWLAGVGIELNFYLVNLDDFSKKKRKKIEIDSCGNTQNYLLLDEFYRTAVWFAGRWPLWWLIPAKADYQKFASRLLKQKHIDAADWIDFGEVKTIPAAEYFSAALWQLYKAIESPYKSSVKLLILEVYAKLFPCAGVLSDQFKQQVYKLDQSDQDLDPYLHILIFAEKALIDNPQRLEFLRRSFYLKANVKIVQSKKRKPSWRYQMISQLVSDWGWKPSRLDYLNSRHKWNIARVLDERKDLVKELTNSYHFLSNFARVQGVINKVTKIELLSLGRQLYAAFERRNGKIEKLNNGIAKEVNESAVTLSHHTQRGWQLFLGHISQNKLAINAAVFEAESVFECLCWAVVNQVISSSSHLHLHQQSAYLNHQFAAAMARDLLKLLENFSAIENKQTFEKEAAVISFGIFVNTRTDPLAKEKKENLYRVTSQSDCLSWAENKTNLANHFDVLLLNSWGEITLQHYSGDTAWIDFFIQHHQIIDNNIDKISLFCRGLAQRDQIIERITKLFIQWKSLLINGQRRGVVNRSILLIGKKWLVIDFVHNEIFYEKYSSLPALYRGLSKPASAGVLEESIKFNLDPWLKLEPFINSVLKRRNTENLELYLFKKSARIVEIIVKSNTGELHFQSHKNSTIEQIISHYQQFFDKIQNRNLLNNGLLETINFYQVSFSNQQAKIKLVDLKPSALYQQFSLVQAIATQKHVFSAGFDLFTADQSYLYSQYGEAVYPKIRAQMLKLRQKEVDYPIFLTDIDLSAIHHKVSIIESLGYKKMIESKLNKAK